MLRALARPAAAALGAWAGGARCEPSRKAEPQPPKSIGELTIALSARARHVFVTGKISDESAKAVIAQLLFLEEAAPGTPIYMHINSGGGKVYAGLAIHDVMAAISSPVHTTCLGHCESMAAVLLAAGEPGERHMMPNARVMVHQPFRSGGRRTNAAEAAVQAAELDKSRLRLVALLARATGRTMGEIEKWISSDHYFSAEEAMRAGLVDRIGCGGVPKASFTRASAKTDGGDCELADAVVDAAVPVKAVVRVSAGATGAKAEEASSGLTEMDG